MCKNEISCTCANMQDLAFCTLHIRGNEETGSLELHVSNMHICNFAISCSFHTCKILFIYISLFITPMSKVQSTGFCTVVQSKSARFCTFAYAQSARCCTLEVQFLAFLHTKKCNISKCHMLTLYERSPEQSGVTLLSH